VSIKSKNHLKKVVIRECYAISPKIGRNLVNPMHRRRVLVIRANDYATKYRNLKRLDVNMFFLSKPKSSVRIDMFWL
jgi:hypothetical protein